MTISKISETKQGRFALFDETGEFLFSVDGETLYKNHIRVDQELSAAQLSQLQSQSDTRRAKDKALEYLSLRDHASGELYEKLCRRFDEQSAAAAVAEMQRLELLDDARFAQHRAKYLAGQNRSVREIRQKLMQAGVGRQEAEDALRQLEPDEAAACRAVLEKKYLRKLREGRRDAVIAALARRGFSYGDIRSAISTYEAGGAGEDRDAPVWD